MKTRVIAALLMTGTALMAGAQTTPTLELKGLRLGATQVQAEELGLRCGERRNHPLADAICSPASRQPLTLAGVAVDAFTAALIEGQVVSITVLVKPKDFELLRAALTEKFGAPAETLSEDVTTGTGVRHTNTIVRWTDGVGALAIERFWGRITTSAVTLERLDYNEVTLRREQQKGKAAVKDL